ncbi:MAG: polysaccharide deacetylase family protein [Chlamydiales bacterium]|nr:polysaccharide deacetylase family protein [Chlamydiales bacterium]
MLLAFMYHRVGFGKHANTEEMLRSHFIFLKEHFPIVLPGDPLQKRKLSVCLTFDDASFDFYHFVFPLLKELNIRALLGIPARYILDSTTLSAEERLSVPYTLAMQDGFFDQKAPFCTWEELNEMVQSGLVEAASHSFMHCNLTFDFVDLNREVVVSKQIIESNLLQPVSSFIYPFGKMNLSLHEYVSQHYPYAFRIGSSLNRGWGKGKKPISRVIGDHMKGRASLLSYMNLAKYALKALVT